MVQSDRWPIGLVLGLWVTLRSGPRQSSMGTLNSVHWRRFAPFCLPGEIYGSLSLVGVPDFRVDIHAGAPFLRGAQQRHLLQHVASRRPAAGQATALLSRP